MNQSGIAAVERAGSVHLAIAVEEETRDADDDDRRPREPTRSTTRARCGTRARELGEELEQQDAARS